jgi:microcystin-dependent protein
VASDLEAPKPFVPSGFSDGDKLDAGGIEQMRFGLAGSGPLAKAVLDSNIVGARDQLGIGVAQIVPAGMLAPYAGSTAPTGWLLCDGASLLRTDYPELFAVIGTTYNPAAPATYFNIPDMQGNVPVGVKSTQTSNPDISALAKAAGTYTKTLNNNDLPNHTHSLGGSTGSFNAGHGHASTLAAPNHTHTTNIAFANVARGTSAGSILIPLQTGANLLAAASGNPSATALTGSITDATTGTGGSLNHSHTLPANTGDNGSTPVAVSLVQPSLALNYIIKT